MEKEEKNKAELLNRLQKVISGYKDFNRAKAVLSAISLLKAPPITRELTALAAQQNMKSIVLEILGLCSFDDGVQKSPMAVAKEISTKAGQVCKVEAALHITYTETKNYGGVFKESFSVYHSFDFKTIEQGKIEQDSFIAKPSIISNIVSDEGAAWSGKASKSTNCVFAYSSFNKESKKVVICMYVAPREQAEKQVQFNTASGQYAEKYLHIELIEIPIKIIGVVSPDKIQADNEQDISLAIQKLTIEIPLPEEKSGKLSSKSKMHEKIYEALGN